ncbi:MAG: U32 family peptidase, partial [Lachnospiraceae bacterium]|nr:U32 family peptidase [Lachnospiraceae bacterium]
MDKTVMPEGNAKKRLIGAFLNKGEKPELLAPAGDYACLKAAVSAGADAVYLGGQKFSARAYAGNFSDEEIAQALFYAHLFGVKIYLTINTLCRREELEELPEWLYPFYEAGLDGVIVQDFGVFHVLKNCFPGLKLHASTQMALTGAFSCEALREAGAKRAVLARELTLEELHSIRKNTSLELEVFIHGAMCYSLSGQCLFSSFLGGRSANRGRCAGPCRQPYQVNSLSNRESFSVKSAKNLVEKPAGVYPLSLKDLCALPLLPKLLEAGIDSLKIEGRMKSPEYVAGVTSVYRKHIDLWAAGKEGDLAADLKLLSGLYMRTGLSTGYFEKKNGKEMITLAKPGYNASDEETIKKITTRYLNKELKTDVSFYIRLIPEKPAYCRVALVNQKTDYSVETTGDIIQQASTRPLDKETILRQFAKTGDSPFRLGDCVIEMEADCFLPVGKLNELRRKSLEKLAERI